METDIDVLSEQSDAMGHRRKTATDAELHAALVVSHHLADVLRQRKALSEAGLMAVEAAATALLPREVARLLAPLAAREREILTLRFGLDRGEPRTLEEVGKHFNLTRERIRQLQARAMCKLRHPAFNPPDTT